MCAGVCINTIATGGVGVQLWQGHDCIITGSGTVFLCVAEDVRLRRSGERTIKIWDLRTASCVKNFEGHANDIWCLGT
jgi:WD40 repeat protein